MSKPDLSTGGVVWIDPEFFSQAVRAELLLHLVKSPLSPEQKCSLIDHCQLMAQLIERIPDSHSKQKKVPNSYAKQKQELEAVEANARRLLASLKGMSKPARDAFQMHAATLALGLVASTELPDTIAMATKRSDPILPQAWDWVEALRAVSAYAAEQFEVSKQSKPDQNLARGLVSQAANHILKITGKRPPSNGAAWFSGFMAAFGKQIKVEIGPRIIASGIRQTTR